MTQEPLDYTQDYHELPSGWEWVRLSSICDAINGRAFKSTEWRDKGLPIIRIQNLKDPEAAFNYFQGEIKDQHRVASGDLLFAWSGTPGTSFGAHIWKGPDAALNQHIFNVRFDRNEIDPKYFLYALNQNVTRYVAQAQGGVGLAHITKSKFLASSIPHAPLAQQKRIVAEIEKQFSRLDEAVANLKRVKANLKRYKAAVLKAAVEGNLTEEWRKAHPDVEPASKLLDRILAERRAKWEEAELAKMEAKGKVPKNDKWKAKYKEPSAPDTSRLPALPDGWAWASVDQICNVQLGKMLDRKKHTCGQALPYLRNINVRWGSVDKSDLLTMFFKEDELDRFGLQQGDVLVCEGGEPGRAAVWDGAPATMKYQKALHRVRLYQGYSPNILVYLLEYLVKSGRLAQWFTGSTIKHFTRESFIQLAVSVVPEEEQHQMILEVDRHLSLILGVETSLDLGLKRAATLRHSILAQQFRAQGKKQYPRSL